MSINLATLPLVVAFTVSAISAGAQTVPVHRKAREVIVTQSSSGEEIRGQLLELSAQTLTMLVDNRRVELPLDQVVRVDARGDSVLNGTLIGALAMGVWCAAICGQGLSNSSEYPSTVLKSAVFGAVIGAGVDALNRGRTTIYSKPKPSAVPVPAPPAARVLFKLRF